MLARTVNTFIVSVASDVSITTLPLTGPLSPSALILLYSLVTLKEPPPLERATRFSPM